MAGAENLTEAEFERWLTPAEAITQLRSARNISDLEAARFLLQWLQHERLIGVAKTAEVALKDQVLYSIGGGHWDRLDVNFPLDDFWQTGSFQRRLFETVTRYVDVAFFDVRFDPDGVAAMLPPKRTITVAIEGVADPDPEDYEPETSEPGPRVSDSLLKAWYEVFKQAYPGNEATNDKALASAKGMFPGKSVDRERVRKLRGPQKVGRKATAD